VSTFLEVFFAFVAGGVTLWGLLELRRYLDRRREARAYNGERTAHESLKAMSTQLQQAAARLSKPHVGPPPTQVSPQGWGNWPPPPPAPPWPYGGKHEETSAIPQAQPPNDPKAY
jgi:hypothetical protein